MAGHPPVAKTLILEVKVIRAWPGAWACLDENQEVQGVLSHEGPVKSSRPGPTTGHQTRSSSGRCVHELGSRGQSLARPPPSSASGRSELCPGTRNLSCVWKTPQIRGFTQAIAPDSSEMGDLLAFRFNAFNPILDPWVFILFRKAVFQRLRHWFCCLCPGPARGDSVTLRSQPASRRRDPQAPAALEGKEGNWVPLSAWSKGQVASFPPVNTVGTATRPKAEASVACSLC